MKDDLSDDAWQTLVEAESLVDDCRKRLFQDRPALLDKIRQGLERPGERAAALNLAAQLPSQDLQQLLPDLVSLASFGHGLTERCREIILLLPASWLKEHVEAPAAAILADGGAEEYRALLKLYRRIDHPLADELARRAADHADSEIREAGEDYFAAHHPV